MSYSVPKPTSQPHSIVPRDLGAVDVTTFVRTEQKGDARAILGLT